MAGVKDCYMLGGCPKYSKCMVADRCLTLKPLSHAEQEADAKAYYRMIQRQSALAALRTVLSYIGEDPERPGLVDTPDRVLKAWEEDWGVGYLEPAKPLVKLFEHEGAFAHDDEEILDSNADNQALALRGEMVTVSDIQLFSHCEHHLAPFFGTAAISYIPTKAGLIGISKLARVVEHFARRLQVQERLTAQIADYLVEHVSPDVGIVIKCSHMCMVSRGVKQPNAKTITSALRGAFYDDGKTRSEFLALTRGSDYSCG